MKRSIGILALFPIFAVAQAPRVPAHIQGAVIASDTKAGLDQVAIELRSILPDGRTGPIIRSNTDGAGHFAYQPTAGGVRVLTPCGAQARRNTDSQDTSPDARGSGVALLAPRLCRALYG